MKKIALYCFISAGMLFAACKKESATPVTYPTTHVRFNLVALEFVQLPVGRYFIYKDSATGSIDSVRVTQSKVEELLHPGRPGRDCGWLCYDPGEPEYYFEKYYLTIRNGSHDWFTGEASCYQYYSGMTFAVLGHPQILIDSNFNLNNSFWHPFTINYGASHYNSIPLLTVEGNTYTDVHQFISTNGLQPSHPNYQGSIYYWVKGIGIIKKEIQTYYSVKTSVLVRYG